MLARRHAPETEDHGIDLAPMLDFVLNLLIFFIITAVFVKEFGLIVNRPGGEVTSGAAGESSISLQILASGVSHAMICTMSGLAVSITGLYPVYYFRARAKRATDALADRFSY